MSETTVALLPAIPAKRYFTIGEVSDLCGVKAHVLRYWEQEFSQLKPVKRRGNRRYYQHHEVLLIRRIRELLYDQGFTINGARNQLDESSGAEMKEPKLLKTTKATKVTNVTNSAIISTSSEVGTHLMDDLRRELIDIQQLLRL